MAREVCERRFTRAPTQAEIEQVVIGSTVRLDQDGREPKVDDLRVSVTNNSRNFVVTEIETTVRFYKGAGTVDGEFDRKDGHSAFVWDLFPATQPGETNSVFASFDNDEAPTPYFTRRSRVKTILPFD